MMTAFIRRIRLPMVSEALTCSCRHKYQGGFSIPVRAIHTDSESVAPSTYPNNNEGYIVNKEFRNRNPRTLEQMGIARKREGWAFQYPPKDFYNKLHLKINNSGVFAWVEHCSGIKIVSANTNEWCIRKFLYSAKDISAAQNLGRIFTQRCIEAGITKMVLTDELKNASSEKEVAFLEEVGKEVRFFEPEVQKPIYRPGIDYEGPNRYGEEKKMKEDYQIIAKD